MWLTTVYKAEYSSAISAKHQGWINVILGKIEIYALLLEAVERFTVNLQVLEHEGHHAAPDLSRRTGERETAVEC